VVSYATPALRQSSDCTGEHIGPRTSLGLVGSGNIPAPAVNQTSLLQLIVFIDSANPTPQNPTKRSDIQTHHNEHKNTQLDVRCGKACTAQRPLSCKKNSLIPHIYS